MVTTTFWDAKKRDAVKCLYISSSTSPWSSDMRLADPKMSDAGICLNHTPFWLKILKVTGSFSSFSRDVCCYVTFLRSFFSPQILFCFSSLQSVKFLQPAVAGEESSCETETLPHQFYMLMSSLTQQNFSSNSPTASFSHSSIKAAWNELMAWKHNLHSLCRYTFW